jgi:hypothetical protein
MEDAMIGLGSFIGTLVEFVLEKVGGHLLGLRLDQRRSAARAFLALHDALIRIEEVADRCTNALAQVLEGSKPRLYGVETDELVERVEKATVTFYEAFQTVHRAVSIIDPNLEVMLGSVQQGKKAFTSLFAAHTYFTASHFAAQMQLETIWDPAVIFRIRMPIAGEVAPSALENLYRAIDGDRKKRRTPRQEGDLLARLVRERTTQVLVEAKDLDGIRHLAELIAAHAQAARAAHIQLGEFTKERFSIEDLLFA